MKIYGFANYLKGTAAEQKAFREKVVKEVLAGGKRREIAKRYGLDWRTLCFWVRSIAGENVKPAKAKEPERKKPTAGKKKRIAPRKRGIPGWKQKWAETRAAAVAAVEAGEKQNAVAKRFGVTRQAINQWVEADAKEYGQGLRHLTERRRRKVRRKVVAMVKAGISQAATARRFGVSELSVGKWVKLYDKGGEIALDIVAFEGSPRETRTEKKQEEEKKAKRFHLRFDIQERPISVDGTSGKALAENFIGQTVACHHVDHDIVGAYFDKERGIVLSYIHVPIEREPIP